MNEYLDIKPEVREALESGAPVVALESTILSHGMPWPENLDFAARVEEVVRAEGAVPATMAIMGGKLKVGLSAEDLEVMCRAENVGKVSRRDVPVYLATGRNGATTVATTMLISALAGVRVFATGGIGGVHRHGEVTMDISAGAGPHLRRRCLRRSQADPGHRPDPRIPRDYGRPRDRRGDG